MVAQLETSGHVTRGYLGVATQGLTGAMTAALHLPSTAGALVASVQGDSPAAKAGLQPGDVIQSVNGAKIASPRELAVDVAEVKPGSTAQLVVLRDGDVKTVQVTVASLPAEGQGAASAAADTEGGGHSIGIALAPISPDLREELKMPSGTRGAVIAQVQPGSAAEQAGVQAGDVVIGVANKAVGSPEEAVAAIRAARAGGKATALRVMRERSTLFVAVPSSQG